MIAQRKKYTEDSMVVEMWTDLICPWCRIGEKHFEHALASFAHRDAVRFVLRSYRLMQGGETGLTDAVVRDKYKLSAAEAAQTFAQLEAKAASVGLQYKLAGSWSGDTLDAHRLLKLADTVGKQTDLFVRFYSAAMSEQRCIMDRAVLRELALAEGLQASLVDNVLESDAYRVDVEADERAMKAYGGRGVPFFVINGRYDFSGAVAPDILFKALNKAWEEENNGESTVGAGVCGADGCVLS